MTEDGRRAAMTEAVLAVIDDLSSAELIGGVTPERIGQQLGYSASSVRYQFGQLFGSRDRGSADRTWTFSRDRLWEVIVDDVRERILHTTKQVCDGYLAALERVAREGHPAALHEAVRADLEAYAPGLGRAPTELSERAYLLAVAACDADTVIARRLHEIRERELALFAPLYVRAFALTGRRPAPGEGIATIAGAVANLVEGASLVRRHTRRTPEQERSTARAMIAVFEGLTEPDPASRDAPLRAMRCRDR